jgi:hypothetical protein
MSTKGPLILLLGHARHGKDTAADYLCSKLGFEYKSTSLLVARHLKTVLSCKYGLQYGTVQDCFNDRVNHRAKWYDEITLFCKDNPSALGDLVYSECNVYCGIRSKVECEAVIRVHKPLVIWVDACDRLPIESADSMQLEYTEPWFFIDNNCNKPDIMFEDLDLVVQVLKAMNHV